jgi:anaerobic magnesium-protoporphyrin IX monomethyl ester cyclase
MDILLAHAYYVASDPAEQRVMKPYAPLGILSIAAYLRERGYAAGVFDATFSSHADFERVLDAEQPGVVGIYVNMVTKFAALAMIAAAGRRGIFVVLGGPEPAFYAEEFLRAGAGAVVIGEGEETLDDLLRLPRLDHLSMETVAGLVFLDRDGRTRRTPPRPFIRDVNRLPAPDRSLVDMRPYASAWKERHGRFSLSLISMRGCPYTCKWCSHGVYGESYRRRSPRLVAEEILTLRDTYAPDAFWFADDVFTISHRWLFALEREIASRNLRIRYECISRADRLTEDVLRTLKATGCTRLWIGSESGSQRILDAMSRGVRVERVQQMTRLARRLGIEVGMFIMLGYPGETRRDIEETVTHLRRARPDIVLTTVAYPIRGTAFYEDNRADLIIPELPFAEWNDRMIDISGRFSKKFYWFANRRVINETAWRRELEAGPSGLPRASRSLLRAKAAQVGMLLTS